MVGLWNGPPLGFGPLAPGCGCCDGASPFGGGRWLPGIIVLKGIPGAWTPDGGGPPCC